MTKKAKTKTRNNTQAQPQAQAQTITLNQPSNAEELKTLFNAFLACVGDGNQAGEIVVTKENGKTTFSRRVGETVTKVVTVVKTKVVATVAKTRSMLRSAWNWTITRITAVRDFVKAAVSKTKAYVCRKAAQLAIAGVILVCTTITLARIGYRKVKTFLTNSYSRCKAATVFTAGKIKSAYLWTKAFVVRKALQISAWIVLKWNELKTWTKAVWTLVKPHAVKAGRIATVTAVLYLFATATVLVTCLAVAVLGLSAYDRACETFVNQTNRNSNKTAAKKGTKTVATPKQKTLSLV